jgi:tetratricopeptide (TPR) repeat protein
MDFKSRLSGMLREAEIYGSQGLFRESLQKYIEARNLIEKNTKIKNQSSLLEAISKKIQTVEKSAQKVDQAPASTKMSAQEQDLVKKLFAYSPGRDRDALELEGALALAKFGQFERALEEFKLLQQKGTLRLAASKNIIRCYMAMSAAESAVEQYGLWLESEHFSRRQLEHLETFFQSIIDKRELDIVLPAMGTFAGVASDVMETEELAEDEIIDISSIVIHFESGPQSGRQLAVDVSFQTGNVISLLISSRDRELIENLKVGVTLNNLQFFSPIAIFKGSGVVSAKTKIESGPKQGDYSLDIRITGAE